MFPGQSDVNWDLKEDEDFARRQRENRGRGNCLCKRREV